MSDVVLLSSVFNQVKLAEPMGVSILAAALRSQGRVVQILEPSVQGWSVEETANQVAHSNAAIVGVSVLRDKNVKDVREFVSALRKRCPDLFIVIGGHGPSISLSTIPDDVIVAHFLAQDSPAAQDRAAAPAPCSTTAAAPAPRTTTAAVTTPCSTTAAVQRTPCSTVPELTVLDSVPGEAMGPVVSPGLTDRGKGPADIDGEGRRQSAYFDVTPDYLAILEHADACLIGECDATFPELVERVLSGADWADIPGLARVVGGRFRRNTPPPKIANLDQLPFMARDVLRLYTERYDQALPASILASRGCYYRCTFCSVVKYERLQQGSRHRHRSNAHLIAEIEHLHSTFGITDFNFEDDNFIVKNAAGSDKVFDFCDQVLKLSFPIRFTFFCRADVVQRELFERLREAGLTGLYFGIESVFEEDLAFFHKGIRIGQIFDALGTLRGLGFSPAVDADLRIMLGYITWHPRSTFASLQESARFIRDWQAPPKLLRRKLRLYSGTEVIDDVARLGLLDPGHPDGWHFADPRLEGLEHYVNVLFQAVNRHRDMVRTLEKAASHGYDLDIAAFTGHRRRLDSFLCEQFDLLVKSAESDAGGRAQDSPEVRDATSDSLAQFRSYLADTDLVELIQAGYRRCGFDPKAVDLFRK